MSTTESTHVRVKSDTKETLEELGSTGDTFDDVIRRLADAYDGAK